MGLPVYSPCIQNLYVGLFYPCEKKQPGDVIECGIFQGLPEPDRQVDASVRFQKGGWAATGGEVEAHLAQFAGLLNGI